LQVGCEHAAMPLLVR